MNRILDLYEVTRLSTGIICSCLPILPKKFSMSLVRRCDWHHWERYSKSHRQSIVRNTLWLYLLFCNGGHRLTWLESVSRNNNKRFNVLPSRSRITSLLIPSKLGLLTLTIGPPWMIYLINILRPIQQGTKIVQAKWCYDRPCLFIHSGWISEASQLASR